VIFLINKLIEEIKKTEDVADKIIKDAEDKAAKIIKEAHREADELIERIKNKPLKKGKK